MRVIELGRIVAQAEALRWRRLGRRQAMRGVMAGIGAVFAIGVLVCAHIAGAVALVPYVGALYATLIVGGVDLVLAAIFLAMAARDSPDRIELEAIAVRDEARSQLGKAAMMSALVLPLVRQGGTAIVRRLLGGPRRSPPNR